jgi:hypothetical protein
MLLKTKGVNILQKNLKISLDDVLLFEAPPPRLLLNGSLKSQNLCPLVCARPNCVRAACNLKRSQDAELSEFDASEFAGASINPHKREPRGLRVWETTEAKKNHRKHKDLS